MLGIYQAEWKIWRMVHPMERTPLYTAREDSSANRQISTKPMKSLISTIMDI